MRKAEAPPQTPPTWPREQDVEGMKEFSLRVPPPGHAKCCLVKVRSGEERLEDKKEVGWMLGLTSFFLLWWEDSESVW